MDPLAKVMRRELKKRGVRKLKVVYSEEKPIVPLESTEAEGQSDGIDAPGAEPPATVRRAVPGSTAFVPSVAGLIIAGEVIKDLAKAERRENHENNEEG